MHNDVSCYATLSLRLFSVVALSLFVLLYFMKYSSRFFFKTFFSLHTEIKVSSCDIYFADNMGETVRHLIGENQGHPRLCIFHGCHPTDVIVFTYVDTLSYIRWTLVFCDNMDQDKGP